MADYGLDISIPFSAGDPDPTLPWADDDDALLVPGSIFLVEPNHSANPIVGVPASGADVPNIAYKRFRDVVGFALFTGRIDNGTVGNAGTVLTVTALASGKIVPGQVITGTGVTASTYVIAQVSGTTGGIGVYTVSISQSAASTTITASAIDISSGAMTMLINNDGGSVFARERTPKGGLHVAISQVNNTAVSQYNAVAGKAALTAYMAANMGHSFYISLWETVTRTAVDSSPPPQVNFATTGSSPVSNFLAIIGHKDTALATLPGPADSHRLGFHDSQTTPNVVGSRYRSLGVAGITGSPTSLFVWPFQVGNGGGYNPNSYGNKSASRILYRAYVEDLTVSGRTYAQVDALDYALQQAAFGPGGRYSGDTYTAPPA